MFLKEYFGKQLKEYTKEDPEKIKELILKMNNLKNTEEWKIMEMVLRDTRERIIDNLKVSPVNHELLLSYKESISAVDFLLNLPDELIKALEFDLTDKDNG